MDEQKLQETRLHGKLGEYLEIWKSARATAILGLGFMFFTLITVGYYIVFPAQGEFHSDCADTILWAQATLDGGKLLNPDFNYAALLPFGGNLIMLPYVALFGVSTTAQALGMLTFMLLFAGALFALFRQLKWGPGYSGFAVGLCFCLFSVSPKLREIFWGHIIYYSLGLLLACAGMALLFKYLNLDDTAPNSVRQIVYLALSALLFTLAATNMLEAFTLVHVPVLVGLVGERFFSFSAQPDAKRRGSRLVAIAVVLLSTGAGAMIGSALCKGLIGGYAAAYSTFSQPNDWVSNLARLLPQWISLLGFDLRSDTSLYSTGGIWNLLRILAGLVLLAAPIILTVLYPKIKDEKTRILILYHWGVTLLVMLAYVFGNLSSAEWRLVPILATSLLLTLALCRWIGRHTPYRRLLLIPLVPLCIVGLNGSAAIWSMSPTQGRDDSLYAVAAYLEENDLTYGFASFWFAGRLTYITDSAVKARNTQLNEAASDIVAYPYQSNKNWYEPQPGQERYFILLRDYDEYDLLRKNECRRLENAISEQRLREFVILIYDEYPLT